MSDSQPVGETAPSSADATQVLPIAPQTIAIAAPEDEDAPQVSPAAPAPQPQAASRKAAPPNEYDFLALMAGAIELKRIAAGRFVEFEGNNYHAFFTPMGAQDPTLQRRVSFLPGDNQIHASTGLGIAEAAYIVALGNKQWGGIKLLSGASPDDKLKLYMAAQTHHLRLLVTQLEQGTISAADKQKLASYIANPNAVPAVRFQDGTALDGGTYAPPAQITRLSGGRQVQVDTAAELLAMKQELAARAVAQDASLNAAVAPAAPVAAPAVVVSAPHASAAVPAARPLPTSRDAVVPAGAVRSTGAARRQRNVLLREKHLPENGTRVAGQHPDGVGAQESARQQGVRGKQPLAALLGGDGKNPGQAPAKEVAEQAQAPKAQATTQGATGQDKSGQRKPSNRGAGPALAPA